MTIIKITPQPDNGALQLAITTSETVTSISRSDANGVADVRTLPGLLPWAAPRVEDLRNRILASTTSTGYAGTRCTFTASDTSYNRATADGTGAAYFYYGGFIGGIGGTMPVVAGDQVATTVQLRNSNGVSIQARLDWYFYDAAGANLPTTSGVLTTITPGSAPRLSTTATAPALAAQARPLVYMFNAAGAQAPAGQTLDWKYWAAYKGPNAWANSTVFFHGAYAAGDVYAYAWAGTAYASESIRYTLGADLIISDFEAASGSVSYTVNGATQATLATTWDIQGPWIFVPVMPSYSVKLKTLLEYVAGGDSLGSIHQLLGRTDPVAILRGMSTRSGSLRLYCGTFAEAVAVVQAVRRGEVLMLRQPEHQGMDMYFTATSYGMPTLDTNGGQSVFGVDLGYTELTRPAGDLSGSLGWTFAGLASSQASFARLPKVYASFQDMLLDKRK